MLAEKLIARAQRCAELNRMLAEDPKHEDAGAWIAEIGQKALNRREERHVAVVRSVSRIRARVAAIEARAQDHDALKARIADLQKRIKAMGADEPGRARFQSKLDDLKGRLSNPPGELHRQKLPALRKRLAELCASDELLTREDVIDG